MIPILKFGAIKKDYSNYVHCYNCKRAMGNIPFNCINDSWYVTTWKRERDVLIDKFKAAWNEKSMAGSQMSTRDAISRF